MWGTVLVRNYMGVLCGKRNLFGITWDSYVLPDLRASLHGIPMWGAEHSFKKSLCLDFAQKRRFYEQALNLERYSATGRGSVENVATRRQQLENSGDLQ